VTFSSAGIYSVQIDGVTVATIDGYSASTIYGVPKSATFLVPSTGAHRLALTMATKNGSASQYYGDISLLQLQQLSGSSVPELAPRIVNFTLFGAAGNTNWDTLTSSRNSYPYGARFDSTGVQNAARWWYVNLAAGTWDFELLHEIANNRGIYSVQIDDVQVGTIDGYAARSEDILGAAERRPVRLNVVGDLSASSWRPRASRSVPPAMYSMTRNGAPSSPCCTSRSSTTFGCLHFSQTYS